ncbi:MAG: D-alanyl-D-alanine carboxypeptidase [Ruminococcaceae bacterium]|nr:D-alanyl-D-alanine carboxypeptidase [Oscillospiraceae bacterium]
MKRIVIMSIVFLLLCGNFVRAEEMNLSAKSAILAERVSGQILYEQNPKERLPMASVTKIMTMLLGIEAVDNGKINMDDMVTVSEYASSMTGSRVFLSVNETISVHDLFKSIAVASGNDAAVAMAEYLAGSESNFVAMMNQRAEELGLTDTHFENCNGLPAENHYSSAYDLMVLSRELLSHETIRPFLTIWMDSLRDGSFTLANTNKLIRFYEGATGIKTGSTEEALFCMSASAMRDGMELIAVVLGCPTSKERFADASSLLNMGFASYALEQGVSKEEEITVLPVEKGVQKSVSVIAEKDFSVVVKKEQQGQMSRELTMPDRLSAPVEQGDTVGSLRFLLDGQEIGTVNAVVAETIKKAGVFRMYGTLIGKWMK